MIIMKRGCIIKHFSKKDRGRFPPVVIHALPQFFLPIVNELFAFWTRKHGISFVIMINGMEYSFPKQKKAQRFLLAGLGTVFLLALLSIFLYFAWRRPRTVSLSQYVTVVQNSSNDLKADIDRDGILADLHLPTSEAYPDAAERLPDVNALMSMTLFLSATEDPDLMQIVVLADTDTLSAYGIELESTKWEQTVIKRIDPESLQMHDAPVSEPEPSSLPTENVLLTSLVDPNGCGYNLRSVCERVQTERDLFCKEKLGDSYKTEKLQTSFSVSSSSTVNLYQACYRGTMDSEDPETAVVIYFRIGLRNLRLTPEGTVVFDEEAECSIQKTESECKNVSSSEFETVILYGGGQRIAGKVVFDQNGFVVFPGQPTSYRMANGIYWSPTHDLLSEDLIWKLTASDSYSLVKILRYARKEIYARYYSAFDQNTEKEFYDYYRGFAWYRNAAGERSMDITETEWSNIRLLREIQSLIEK